MPVPPPPLPIQNPPPPPEWLVGPTGYGGWLLLLSLQCLYGVVHLSLAAFKVHHLQNGLLDLLAATSDGLLLAMLVARSRLAGAALYAKLLVRLLISGFNLHLAWTLAHAGTRNAVFIHGLLRRQGSALAFTLPWIFYWHLSRRVRNTYGTSA